jgi:hypothetical protein
MSNSPYNVVVPTSQEPAVGFSPNDRVVFMLSHPGKSIRQNTVRMNGVLQITNNGAPFDPALTPLSLNPNAGISGFIKTLGVKLGGRPVENLVEFGRLVALKNEAKYAQIEHGAAADGMLELMGFSNDAYDGNNDSKVFQPMKFPIDKVIISDVLTNTSELPFSVNLDFCLNNVTGDLPYSKTGDIEISIILQDVTKCGMLASPQAPASFSYNLKYLEFRYVTVPEVKSSEPLLMEIKNNSAIPTVYQSRFSALEFAPSNSFHSVFAGFHDAAPLEQSTLALNKDYLRSEALPQIDYLEVKMNGMNSQYMNFPLRLQTSEILYNYLRALNVEVKQHGLTYTKLGNVEPTGFGLGVAFGQEIPAGTRLSFNMNFQELPETSYNAYFFTVGTIQL